MHQSLLLSLICLKHGIALGLGVKRHDLGERLAVHATP
jgi:hypothetical protein